MTIQKVAAEFDRLFSHDETLVDNAEIDWGEGTEAGYIGRVEYTDGWEVIGWYGEGGSVGYPVFAIASEDTRRAAEALAELDVAKSLGDIEQAFVDAGVRFERLA